MTEPRRGDKFDQSMTRGKLLDSNTTISIFYFYANDDPRDKEKRMTEPILGTPIFGTNQTSYNRLNWKALVIG